jgi:hypothetical protein
MRPARGLVVAAGLLLAVGCGGGPKTVSRDGYQATLAFSQKERFQVAVRGESRRVEAAMDGAPIVKIMRPDLKKIWEFRPATKRLMESEWAPTDEIVPGYPLAPGFDPEAYADRFGATIRRIADDVHGLHPCDRWEMLLPSGDVVTIWAARDLERLVVKIEHAKKDQGDEYQPFMVTELLDVRVGADPDLFEKPKGYAVVTNEAELQ